MIRKGKWLRDATAAHAPSDVAQQAAAVRLQLVLHYLPLAARQADDDVEYVHQLRVGTRRASAAIRLFGQLMPPRRGRWMLKQLKEVRRAAGDARDLDVLLLRLQEEAAALAPSAHKDICAVCCVLQKRRRKAQKPLEKIYRRLDKDALFERRVEQVVQRVRWRGKGRQPELGTLARSILRPLFDEFLEASSADLSCTDNLHQLRIRGKQLRYAMELLSSSFEPSFRTKIYPVVVEVQQKLGDINDHASARRRFERWLADCNGLLAGGSLDRLLAREEVSIETGVQDFGRWWTAGRVSDFQQRLEAVLEPNS